MRVTRRRFLIRSAAFAAGVSALGISEVGQTRAAAPAPVREPLRINHDLHTHTVYSDGAASIPLHVFEARAFELDAMAITDHFTPGSKIYDSEAGLDSYLAEIERERSAQYVELVKLFAAEGVTFQVSSDDHRTGLGNTRWSRLVLARAEVTMKQIVDPRQISLRRS